MLVRDVFQLRSGACEPDRLASEHRFGVRPEVIRARLLQRAEQGIELRLLGEEGLEAPLLVGFALGQE